MEKGKTYIVLAEDFEFEDISVEGIGVYVGNVCVQPPSCRVCGEYLTIVPEDKLGVCILSCDKCKKMGKMVVREVEKSVYGDKIYRRED